MLLNESQSQSNLARKPWKVAHRGWHRTHIENTMEAFQAAYAAGCDMVEFDVQLSRDGVPVIFHDDDCYRLVGEKENLFDLDWKQIQSLTMMGPSGSEQPSKGYRIPSLQEFLKAFGNRAFYLELKIPQAKSNNSVYFNMLGDICSRMVLSSVPDPRTFLGSFHSGILRHLASRRSFPVLAGIFENYSEFYAVHSGEDLETASAIRYYSVSWEIFLKHMEALSMSAHAIKHEEILIWNIQGEKDFRQANAHGVAGVVTDDVEILLSMPEFIPL